MNKSVRFIGVTGPAVAGKDTVARLVCEVFGAENLSTGDSVRPIVRFMYRLPADHMPTRDQMYPVANFLRSIDPGFTVKVCMKQAELLNIDRAVISGMRSLAEAQTVQQNGGIVIGVMADQKVRYDRIRARARDAESGDGFEDFVKRDNLENEGIDGNGINAILEHADILIENNTNNIDELRDQLRQKLSAVLS